MFTLEDIRRHPQFPFDNWKTDDVSFLMAELYWAELVRGILGENMQNYEPLFDTQRDGNPILDLTNQAALRGLRLIMIDNEDGKPPYPARTGMEAFYGLQPFTNTSRLPDGQTPVFELVMLVSIDERYLGFLENMIRQHCCNYVSPEQMDEVIADYESKVSLADPAAGFPDD